MSNAFKALAAFPNAIEQMQEAKRLYAAVYGADHDYVKWAQWQVDQLQQAVAGGSS